MGNFALGMIVEGAVSVLLVITIGYCYVLNFAVEKTYAMIVRLCKQ